MTRIAASKTPPVGQCMGRNAAARHCGCYVRSISHAAEQGGLPRYKMADGTWAYWLRDLDRWNKRRGK